MRIVALLAIRNEELYLKRCLEHLFSQGIETCIIDNGSTDRSLGIAETFLDRGVFKIEHIPFNGTYEWLQILRFKERLAQEISADWFIHYDADEIREAPSPYQTLVEGIKDVDRQGYNAINFDEFVFIPTTNKEAYEGTDYVKTMRYYYYFQSKPLYRINAWKKTSSIIDLSSSGGHRIQFDGINVFPVNFILRHYIILSKAHAITKYGKRIYSAIEVEQLGWHRTRATFSKDRLKLPTKKELHKLNENGCWNKSNPWLHHKFLQNQEDSTTLTKKLKYVFKKLWNGKS